MDTSLNLFTMRKKFSAVFTPIHYLAQVIKQMFMQTLAQHLIWVAHANIYFLKGILKASHLHRSKPDLRVESFSKDRESLIVRLGSSEAFALSLFYFIFISFSVERLIFAWSQKAVMDPWAIELLELICSFIK